MIVDLSWHCWQALLLLLCIIAVCDDGVNGRSLFSSVRCGDTRMTHLNVS
jgi:hypothetical protein